MQEFDEFIKISARIGHDTTLVQGGGGNSSIKIGKSMWVKASGYWMRDADSKSMFVEVDREKAHHIAKEGTLDFSKSILSSAENTRHLRPSIETGLHALLPHRVVLHVHAVNTIVNTISGALRNGLTERLDGIRWCYIPYVKPGPSLSLELLKHLSRAEIDVVILENHGLVVGAETAALAENLIHEIEGRLQVSPRPRPNGAIPTKSAPDGYHWSDCTEINGLAYETKYTPLISPGALVPDQVVYLGGGAAWAEDLDGVDAIRNNWIQQRGRPPGLVFVARTGTLLLDGMNAAGLAIVHLLMEVVRRVPSRSPLTVIDDRAQLELLNWEAEQFRAAVDHH